MFNKTLYLNFSPTEGFKLYTHALVTKLLDLSPSDSVVKSEIEKVGDRYACRLEVTSRFRRFVSFCESAHPKSALEEARRRVMRQLDGWKNKRMFTPSFV